MHKYIGVFWLVLAMLYAGLAAVSYHYGGIYDDKLAKAPTEQVTETATKTIQLPFGSVNFGSSSAQSDATQDAQSDAVATDLWKDLRDYLKAATVVNLIGFGLAALAALVSFGSSRSEAR